MNEQVHVSVHTQNIKREIIISYTQHVVHYIPLTYAEKNIWQIIILLI